MIRAFLREIRRTLRGLDRPERAALLVVALLHGVALTWGLPSSDSWDNDGVAPRDFLPGLIQTLTPGDYYTYPPLQLLFIAVLTLPVSLVALARAPSLAPTDVIGAFLSPGVMTSFTLVARLLSFVQSLGIALAVGELAVLVARDRRARVYGIVVAGCEVTLTYYAHTTNLDVPYLFWSLLALLVLARAYDADAPKALRGAAVLAGLAVATKDQAYALFLLTAPVVAVVWLARTKGPRAALLREIGLATLLTTTVVLVVGGAPFNPRGFLARVRFLLGPASQDFAQYSKDASGAWAAFVDTWRALPVHFPLWVVLAFALGLAVALRRGDGERARDRLLAVLPALAALSFTLGFNCWARRVEERFEMPQMVLVATYGAVLFAAGERLARARGGALALAFRATAALLAVSLVHKAACVDAVLLEDPRYQVERFLAERARPGDRVEVYGRNVYLPRFPPGLEVTRVAPTAAEGRSPMPGIRELVAPYGQAAERRPRFIVVGAGFAWRYLIGLWGGEAGRVQPKSHSGNLVDTDATRYFHALFEGRAGYREVLHARREGRFFPTLELHATLGMQVHVFERVAP